jgi:DtxR family Mn-dependent transcriptional regulator
MTQIPRPTLSSSQEDYLEAVLDLVRTGRVARVRDIARRLGVGMPSVSVALKALSARGLVNYDPYQVVTLTDRGQQVGEGINHRHAVLQDFLTEVLGVEPVRARSNACRMEHAIDDGVLDRLRDFARFVQRCPRIGRKWPRPPVHRGRDRATAASCRGCVARGAAVAPGNPRPKAQRQGSV